MKIEDISNGELRRLLGTENPSDEDISALASELFKSTLIIPCVNADDGVNFVLIWNSQDEAHLPLFTDIDEFEKIFESYDEVFAQAYDFDDILSVAEEKIVINPASESFVFDPDALFTGDKMDEKKLEELKKETQIDNSCLEEIMAREITPEMQREFFEAVKDAQLYLPVSLSENMFAGIENAKEGDVFEPEGQPGFNINYLTNSEGEKAVPLFTSDEMMEKSGLKSSAMIMYVSDIVEMLSQSERYSTVVINPLTETELNIPMEAFINILRQPTEEENEMMESINRLVELLEKHSVELEENTTLFIRLDENLMVENAVDGVFTVHVPVYVSSNPKYREDLKYTNILLMPKSKKILPIGPSENDLDIVIAPGTEFHLEDTMDETTNLWMCGDQPFYDGR